MVPTRWVGLVRRLYQRIPRRNNVVPCGNFMGESLTSVGNDHQMFRAFIRSVTTTANVLAPAGGSQVNDGVAPNTDNCGGNKFAPACIAPQLVANYDEIVDLPNHPEKLLIDVREPTELAATGRIPTSINIPLKTVRSELNLNPEVFETKYGRKKPAAEDPIIFSCRSGVRAGQAAFEADQLGFQNVKNYVGSWQEWGPRHGLPVN